MANRDFVNSIDVASTILPAADRTVDVTGSTVDLRGADSAAAIVHYGVITDGGFTAKLQESADDSTWTDVAAADQVGSFTEALAASDETTQSVSYIGSERYLRVFIEETTAGTTGGEFSAVVVKHNLSREPSDFTVDSATLVG